MISKVIISVFEKFHFSMTNNNNLVDNSDPFAYLHVYIFYLYA